ncbi:hypothetical protein J18TS1_22420 [Oceanobacillus oncorhynchi subsp. incaldanensis]|uniref:ABC-2 family transporter protein n=2 Tax=Oceanobacillus TaxID=182709 RepID=A0A0A1MQV1_9BACI|nr:hypothetical protein [Oceanobacillus oncorhynchi]MDM8098607.1 hypothetical protein [Oceanobacillus oncorhynchi]GIO19142.1 hypothetical protein J18TS1_22420 [Oceanobacillus oncorhynchi subsp. incaldanensis]CEI81401.1 hypothetical protein BN997_01221 [Oceanobacillus oncorhynchi]
MNNQIKGMFYYYTVDVVRTAKIFFSILTGIIIASAIICYLLLGVDEFKMYFAIPFATYFNVGIVGFQLVKGNVPFGLKMGATRKNMYVMQLYFMFAYSLAIAFIGSTLQQVTEWLFQAVGVTNYIYVHPAMFLTDNWIMRIVVDALVMFLIMAVLYYIALLFYRTGLVGGGTVLGVLMVVTLYGAFEGWLVDAVVNLFSDVTIMTFVSMFFIGIVFYLIGFPFMRKITIVNRR